MAANAIGAVWSCCSPDFGAESVIDRFSQIEPSVLITVDGYSYNGKKLSRTEVVEKMIAAMPSIKEVIQLNYLDNSTPPVSKSKAWEDIQSNDETELVFDRVSFDHPIWILYSSGTTGQPKPITHSVGGILLEHLKYHTFHNDTKPGERYFWFTTTGWMMWNFVQSALLCGASIVLFDGSPGYPDIESLWRLVAKRKITHFGTSAPFIIANMKKDANPSHYDLSSLRSISSTGSPLPPEGFEWIQQHIENPWLISMSGGTDVCSAFVGGCPWKPVHQGEIQCITLGCDLHAFDEQGNKLINEVGEMVITKAMPSMPIYFWNDPEQQRYRESYFEQYEGIWRHGDWVLVTDRNTLVIHGRSDATLNRHGIRIGTAEIYRVLDGFEEIQDGLILNMEQSGGQHYMPLFLMIKPGYELNDDLIQRINQALKVQYSPRHVPDEIIEVKDIPYTISGKKMEAPVKKILMGIDPGGAVNLGAMRNPGSIDFFVDFYRRRLC
jgi:acetoacetyl-CoA synthetase